MSDLQHQRIDALCQELRLGALASLYGPIAQDAAKRKNASYADFLEEALRAERDARRVLNEAKGRQLKNLSSRERRSQNRNHSLPTS